MMKWIKIFYSLPKTIYVNFVCLPFRQAVKLPIFVKYNTKLSLKGYVRFRPGVKIKPALVRIGFHEVPIKDPSEKSALMVFGSLFFYGSAHIGCGSRIHVAESGILNLGDNFAISASTAINCYNSITFGRDIQFSWDCLVMDSDTHRIFDLNGEICNQSQGIIFGDKIWIGCGVTVLKGAHIPSNCVIGAESVVSGTHFEENSIIVGSPAKSIKGISHWEL